MKIVLLLLSVFSAFALFGFTYQQLIVEGEFGPAAIVGTAALSVLTLILAYLTYLSGTRQRAIVRNLFMAFSVFVVSYLIIDLLVGQLLIVPLSPPLVPDLYRHHALVPDSYAELRQRDFKYIQRTNKLGVRGKETTIEKPAGRRRILMLGDSFTMGKGVEEAETFSVLVENMLQKSLSSCDGETVEVINGGIDSYAPILSYLQLKHDLARLSPDLIVLNLDNSDLVQEQAYRKQAVRDESGEIVAVPQVRHDSLYKKFQSWSARNLYFTRIVLVYAIRAMDYKDISVRRVVNEFGREHFAHTLEGDIDRSAQWQDIFKSIKRIKKLSDSMDSEFLLSTYPWAHQVNDTDWVPGRYGFMKEGEKASDVTKNTIRKYSANLSIDLYEALPEFQKYRGSEPLYFKYDPHWTATGHRVMAEGLARYIKVHYLPEWFSCIKKL